MKTAHLVLWLAVSQDGRLVVKDAGIYSEDAPTSIGAVLPVALAEAKGEDFGAAVRQLTASIEYNAKYHHNVYGWILAKLRAKTG